MARRIMQMVSAAALAVMLLSVPAAFAADGRQYIYHWKDDRGNEHIADSLDKVPAKYRSKARVIEQNAAGEQPVETPVPPASPADEPEESRREEERKQEWQQRVLDAKRRIAEADALYQMLEQQKKNLSEQYGGGTTMVTVQTPKGPVLVPSGAPAMPQEVMDRIRKIEQNMDDAKREREAARNELENVIPDEARKAGIPPGWLREVE